MANDIDEEISLEETTDEATETSTVEFNIVVTATDWSLQQLAVMFDAEDIIVPDYQRKYVWDIRRASKLVESFAIGLPVPQVFFYENSEGQLEVIDGQQRITSIAYFFGGYFGPPNAKGNQKVFKLTGLEQRKDLEGKSFEELDDRTRRKLQNASLRGVTVKQLTPDEEQPESVYHIFERLNTGGQPLNAQEIRNAVYRGPILAMLEELNMDPNWRTIYGKAEPDPKQRDIELILRLFSLFENINEYLPPMKDFLSREMANNRDFDNDRSKRFVEAFSRASQIANDALAKPFRPRGLLNAATLEAVMGVLMENAEAQFTNDIYEKLILEDGFVEAFTSNTTSREQVLSRRQIAEEKILADA